MKIKMIVSDKNILWIKAQMIVCWFIECIEKLRRHFFLQNRLFQYTYSIYIIKYIQILLWILRRRFLFEKVQVLFSCSNMVARSHSLWSQPIIRLPLCLTLFSNQKSLWMKCSKLSKRFKTVFWKYSRKLRNKIAYFFLLSQRSTKTARKTA